MSIASSDGTVGFDGPVSSFANGTLLLREFRNITASPNAPVSLGSKIGDVHIQY